MRRTEIVPTTSQPTARVQLLTRRARSWTALTQEDRTEPPASLEPLSRFRTTSTGVGKSWRDGFERRRRRLRSRRCRDFATGVRRQAPLHWGERRVAAVDARATGATPTSAASHTRWRVRRRSAEWHRRDERRDQQDGGLRDKQQKDAVPERQAGRHVIISAHSSFANAFAQLIDLGVAQLRVRHAKHGGNSVRRIRRKVRIPCLSASSRHGSVHDRQVDVPRSILAMRDQILFHQDPQN